MRLYNTATRGLEELPQPGQGRIGMYFCGPTVYQRIHVGNARPFVVSMWLRRWLLEQGYEVTLVENITDINDKIYRAAPGRERRSSPPTLLAGTSRTPTCSVWDDRTSSRSRPSPSPRSSR